MELRSIIQSIYTLPTMSENRLVNLFSEVNLPKGEILFHADKTEKKIYFIKSGILRAYAYANDNEITFWFGQEGDQVMSIRNYIESKPSYENIELLEDCILYGVDNTALQQMYMEDVYIANWGRKLAEKELLKNEERFISRQFKTATERYHDLIKENPQLLQRVQLGYIASYLGITQVSLSRIRAEIK